jgi:Ca-activated chloride channel family protein
MKGGNNRVILATDGDFNVGQSSDGELVEMIEKRRKTGIFLTVLGFGTGNYQDAKMQKLADKGNGNHAYIDNLLEARKVLVSEMGGTLLTIAKDVKIQVEFNPTYVKGYRLIGYENRMLKARDFKDDKKDAGELGAGHSVTALYELIPAGSKEPLVAVDRLKYQSVAHTAAARDSGELMTVKLRYKRPKASKSILLSAPVVDRHVALSNTSADFRFATAVAEFGLLLRKSPHKGKASYKALVARARGALGKDEAGYRFEFVKLAQKAAILGRTASR